MPLHVSSTSAHRQEAKTVLHNSIQSSLNLCTGRPPIGVTIPEAL